MFHDPQDPNNCFIDIQAGAAAPRRRTGRPCWSACTLRYCERSGLQAEVLEESEGEVAGIKTATIKVSGDYAYGHLRTEAGIHRLVRKSPYDSNARRHTSFASVFIYPEVDDTIQIEINPADLRVDTFPRQRRRRPAHQQDRFGHPHHAPLPTNIVVQCQNDRSQHRNRAERWRC